jgi:hypothetical protein
MTKLAAIGCSGFGSMNCVMLQLQTEADWNGQSKIAVPLGIAKRSVVWPKELLIRSHLERLCDPHAYNELR